MAGIIVQSLEGNIRHAFSLLDKFVEVCPEDLWAQKFGGWPVWQQVYHALTALDFFIRPLDAPEEALPFGEKEAGLDISAANAVSKAQLKAYAEKMYQRVDAYIASLDDAALAQSHAGLAARLGMPSTHANALCLIAAHTLYHLGGCDAALRERGLAGVF